MYKFSLPDSFAVRASNKVLLYALWQHRNWFYDDFIIDCAYGCPGTCIWNGNRCTGRENGVLPTDFAVHVITMYARLGVWYRLIFTNRLLEKKHLYDTYSNKLAEIMNFQGASAMVSLPVMAAHLKKNYPNIKVCWSTSTHFGNTVEEQIRKINKLSRDSLVVVPYQFNNKPEILTRLKYPQNIEFLVNEECADCCTKGQAHWDFNNRMILMEDADPQSEFAKYSCPMAAQHPEFFKERFHRIPREKLAEYAKLGFTHFKFEGRGTVSKVNETVINYLLLPGREKDYMGFYDKCMGNNFADFEKNNGAG